VSPGVSPGSIGSAKIFFASRLAGLDTALGVLSGGFVVVGNVPTSDGTFRTIGQGALQFVDRNGSLVKTHSDPRYLDSPWDLVISEGGEHPQIFVANVLSGTVSRLDVSVGPNGVSVLQQRRIAEGYAHRPNAAALVLGPTGLAYDRAGDKLYVASTADNAIYAIASASRATSPVDKGALVFDGPQLRGPLALVFAPNGHLLAANGDAVNGDPKHPSEIVEITTTGEFVREFNVDAQQGGAFGLATVASPQAPFNFAAVDDVPNVLLIFQSPPEAW